MFTPLTLRVPDPAAQQAMIKVCELVRAAGGRALLVGGSVRDAARGEPAKDLDLEVYGLGPELLLQLVAPAFPLDLVGQAFGVLKLRHLPIDISIPRRESKHGLGHKGFTVYSDPSLTPLEASARRDFTINAILYDPLTGETLDPWHGRRDLEAGILRHVSPAFAEDPLRVLRGMQFIARFNLTAAPETVALCRAIPPEGLAQERLFDEWRKWLLQGRQLSRGLAFLRECGWLQYHPELAALIDCPQDPEWHPEGDVWAHTLHCMDAYARQRTGEAWEDLVVGWAVLCHDFGKPATTQFDRGRYRSHGHEAAGEAPTRAFLGRLTRQQDLIEAVVPLVVSHLAPQELFEVQAGDAAIRRLARRMGRIDRLVRVARADQAGRPPRDASVFPAGDWLLARAQALAVQDAAPKPLVQGRHLLALGLAPGPLYKKLLDRCYEAQIEGRVTTLEEGLLLIEQWHRENG